MCAACIAVGMQAQTYMVNDFESGLNGANAAWGGTAELIDNPCSSSDNSSTKVLKVVSIEYANVAIPLNLPEGKTLADYAGVRLQLAVLEGSENITWVGNELGLVDNDTQEKTFQVALNSWETLRIILGCRSISILMKQFWLLIWTVIMLVQVC